MFLSTLVIVRPFHFSRPGECGMVPVVLISISLMSNDIDHLFIELVSPGVLRLVQAEALTPGYE